MGNDMSNMINQFEPSNRGNLIKNIEEMIKSGKDQELSNTLVCAGMWDLSIAELMISKGVKLDAEIRPGETPILYACRQGYPQFAELLIRNGVSANSKDATGKTCLIKACVSGHDEVVSMLLSKKADPSIEDDRGLTALFYACALGHMNIARTLIEKGKVDINQPNKPGKSVVLAAYAQGHMKLGKYLANKVLKELQDNFNYADQTQFKLNILAAVDDDNFFPIKANHVLLVDYILQLKTDSKKFFKLKESHKEKMMFMTTPDFKEKLDRDVIDYLKGECEKLEKALEKFMKEGVEVEFKRSCDFKLSSDEESYNLKYSDIKEFIPNNGLFNYIASETTSIGKLEKSMLLTIRGTEFIGNFNSLINMAKHLKNAIKSEKFITFFN